MWYFWWSTFRALLQDHVVEVPADATRDPHQRCLVSGGEATGTAFPLAREN
jgi:hypothetical protein